MTCYNGYVLNTQGQCVVNPQPFVPVSNSLCATWNNTICLTCSYRAYFDERGVCQPVSGYCNTWDLKTGACFTCFPGFALVNEQCQLAPSITPADIGCKLWNWSSQVCLACSTNWVFNQNKVCIPVSTQCRTSDDQGLCTACYKGYDLAAGSCVFSPSNTAAPTDGLCSIWDWNNNKCLKCSSWAYFNTK